MIAEMSKLQIVRQVALPVRFGRGCGAGGERKTGGPCGPPVLASHRLVLKTSWWG
jgi:hypothetical protein